MVLQSLSVAPDPISIPGSLRVSAAVKSGKTMGSPLKVSARCASVWSRRAELPQTTGSWEMPVSGYRNESPWGVKCREV